MHLVPLFFLPVSMVVCYKPQLILELVQYPLIIYSKLTCYTCSYLFTSDETSMIKAFNTFVLV